MDGLAQSKAPRVTQPLAVITNSNSTQNKLRGDWIDVAIADEPNVFHFKLEDVNEIPDILRQCAALGAEVIAVNGGDGTADLVFDGLLNHDIFQAPPALALLPAGKTNMTAASWSLTGEPDAALRTLLKNWKNNLLSKFVIERPVLGVHRSEHPDPLYGAFFGAAEVVSGILFCRKHIYPLGMPNAISHAAAISILLWRSLFTPKGNEDIKVACDSGFHESGKFFTVAVTALDQLVLGIRPQPKRSAATQEPLTYLSLRPGAYSTLRALGSLATRTIMPGPGRVVRATEKLTLNFTGPFTLDGEMYETNASETITLDGSKQLRFVRLPKAGAE